MGHVHLSNEKILEIRDNLSALSREKRLINVERRKVEKLHGQIFGMVAIIVMAAAETAFATALLIAIWIVLLWYEQKEIRGQYWGMRASYGTVLDRLVGIQISLQAEGRVSGVFLCDGKVTCEYLDRTSDYNGELYQWKFNSDGRLTDISDMFKGYIHCCPVKTRIDSTGCRW